MFFTIITIIWALIHVYIGRRVIGPLKLNGRSKMAARLAVFVMFALLPLAFFLNRAFGASEWAGLLSFTAYLFAGFTMIVFPMLFLWDAGELSLKIFSRLIGPRRTKIQKPDPSRRMFLANSMNLGIFGFSGILTGFGYHGALSLPDTVRVIIPITGLHAKLDGFRIAQISDTHASGTVNADYIKGIVDSVNREKPDIVCITGDLADGYVPDLKHEIAPLGDLRATDGVYFVTGNHEYYWDCLGWLDEVRKLNIDVLLNEHRIISKGSAKILIAGVTDHRAGRYIPGHASDPEKAVHGAAAHDLSLMLAHQPRSAPKVAETKMDIQLSGHTHGGQFFPWNFVVPLFHPAPTGLSRYNGMWVYVSRGSGHWGPPVRLGSSPEVTLITLKTA